MDGVNEASTVADDGLSISLGTRPRILSLSRRGIEDEEEIRSDAPLVSLVVETRENPLETRRVALPVNIIIMSKREFFTCVFTGAVCLEWELRRGWMKNDDEKATEHNLSYTPIN